MISRFVKVLMVTAMEVGDVEVMVIWVAAATVRRPNLRHPHLLTLLVENSLMISRFVKVLMVMAVEVGDVEVVVKWAEVAAATARRPHLRHPHLLTLLVESSLMISRPVPVVQTLPTSVSKPLRNRKLHS